MTMRLAVHPPHEAAIVSRDATWAYGDLDAAIAVRVRRLASVEPGLVALEATTNVEFVATLLALLELGRAVAVCSASWTPDERVVRHRLLGGHVEVDGNGEIARRWGGAPAAVDPRTRLILFTTGSTGRPKAVQLSEANIRANTIAVIDALDFHTASRQTLFLPLSYSFGLLGQLLPALELGIPTRLVERLIDLPGLFDAGEVRGMISGVPSHFEAILRSQAASFVCGTASHVVTAGAYSSPELRRRLQRAFPHAVLFNNYGQTEVSPRILCFSSKHPLFYTAATGYPVGGLRVRLGADGEFQVSGSQVMIGYLADEEGTRRKVREGWLATGDQGTIAPDGLVTITGRLDDLVNIGGERTSAREIETALRSLPGVAEAAVVFVPDAIYGVAGVAFVEPSAGALTQETLLSAVRRLVSGHKVPREVHLMARLPRNAHGKIDRASLQAAAAVDPTAVPTPEPPS